jgi:RNA polymerase sigma-70 factor (ECF subfamily)
LDADMNLNDENLLRSFQNGNPHAFETLFHRYKDQTYDFAYRMLGNRESAGDITQEVFIKLFNSQRNPVRINNLKNYLFILTRNMCLNRIRDTKKEIDPDSIVEEKSIGSEITNLQLLKLKKAFTRLEPDLKEALILREYQGFSYKEISEILGISISAVKSLLFRARLKLKEIYEKTN